MVETSDLLAINYTYKTTAGDFTEKNKKWEHAEKVHFSEDQKNGIRNRLMPKID